MEIEVAKKLKEELELELARLISEEVRTFSDNTGLVIDSIDVRPVYTTWLGSSKKSLMAVSVAVKIEI